MTSLNSTYFPALNRATPRTGADQGMVNEANEAVMDAKLVLRVTVAVLLVAGIAALLAG
jgi:hypothetical protein